MLPHATPVSLPADRRRRAATWALLSFILLLIGGAFWILLASDARHLGAAAVFAVVVAGMGAFVWITGPASWLLHLDEMWVDTPVVPDGEAAGAVLAHIAAERGHHPHPTLAHLCVEPHGAGHRLRVVLATPQGLFPFPLAPHEAAMVASALTHDRGMGAVDATDGNTLASIPPAPSAHARLAWRARHTPISHPIPEHP